MNSYAALTGFDEEDDDTTVIASNCSKEKQQRVAMSAQAQFKIPDNRGIADAGCTSHFVTPRAPVINVKKAKIPITISQPDGRQLKSTHKCKLDIPALPKKAQAAHIVPGLAHTSLVSIKMLVDEGCNVEYDSIYVKVFHNKQIVWQGTREQTTGLWTLPLNKQHIQKEPKKQYA